MDSCSSIALPENLLGNLEKGLSKGKEFLIQLQTQLLHHNPFGENGSIISTEELASKILTSFNEAISEIKSVSNNNNNNNKTNNNHVQCSSDHDHQSSGTVINGGPDMISQINPHEPLDHHSHCDDRSSEDTGESSKKRPSSLKDRRGCYKRRKSSQSWSTKGSTIEDGQAWRKYGQKEILNSEYPRAYFRCTKKHEQGCKATKQVQQTQSDPKMYQTTYIGHHTCKHILKAPQMIVDSQPFTIDESPVYKPAFDSSRKSANATLVPNSKYPKPHHAPILMEERSAGVLLKEESRQISDEDMFDNKKSSFVDVNDDLWFDFKDIELAEGLLSSPSKKMAGSDHNGKDIEDSVAFPFYDGNNVASLISLDNDYAVKAIGFQDNDFHFDESDFP